MEGTDLYQQPGNQQLDQVFMALADGTRRELVALLTKKECTMNELAEPFAMSLAAVSKHVKVLERAGLIKRRVIGRYHFLTLLPERLSDALDWISTYRNFRSQGLDRVESTIKQQAENQE